jgi:hypothetical protein
LLGAGQRLFPTLVRNGTLSVGPIPRGTPISLMTNLDLGADLPKDEQLRHFAKFLKLLPLIQRDVSNGRDVFSDKEVVDGLLDLSKCPDFVVNKGHYFGTNLLAEEPGLNDTEKRDLIGFIKTF